MAQRGECVVTGVVPGIESRGGEPEPAVAQSARSVAAQQWRGPDRSPSSTPGCKPGPRLPNVEPGGDYVEATDGLTDCDGHGTLVAGLIAGQPGPDGFSGVAPGGAAHLDPADLGAVRTRATWVTDPALTRAALDVETLARAVVRAADWVRASSTSRR